VLEIISTGGLDLLLPGQIDFRQTSSLFSCIIKPGSNRVGFECVSVGEGDRKKIKPGNAMKPRMNTIRHELAALFAES
jgi:hypothetical protein